MNFRIRGVVAVMVLLAGAASSAFAATTPVTVDLTALRCILKYTLDDAADDQVYVLVNGIAAGKEFQTRIPDGGKTWPADKKKPPVLEKHPVNLWKGELNDGEFAVVTISIFQGDGKNEALTKQYLDSIIDAAKKAPEYDKKTLTAPDFKSLTGDVIKRQWVYGTLVKNQRTVISKIKNSFSREKQTDHFCGLFDITVWNDGTTIRKRLDPIGLTFGEHFGIDEKIYTKLKYTRNNVFIQDEKGEWSNDPLNPLSDDEKTIHVKMLENEVVKGKDGNPARKTTDYLADVQVTSKGQAVKWRLEAEETGVDDIHRYWQFAD
jgi:hypothetical protein